MPKAAELGSSGVWSGSPEDWFRVPGEAVTSPIIPCDQLPSRRQPRLATSSRDQVALFLWRQAGPVIAAKALGDLPVKDVGECLLQRSADQAGCGCRIGDCPTTSDPVDNGTFTGDLCLAIGSHRRLISLQRRQEVG